MRTRGSQKTKLNWTVAELNWTTKNSLLELSWTRDIAFVYIVYVLARVSWLWKFKYYVHGSTKILNFDDCFLMLCVQTPGLNIITEYVFGLIYPGRPIANVCFKTYGYISMAQAVSFLSDFKLGHYMKIPPRSMFLVQVYSWSARPFLFPPIL